MVLKSSKGTMTKKKKVLIHFFFLTLFFFASNSRSSFSRASSTYDVTMSHDDVIGEKGYRKRLSDVSLSLKLIFARIVSLKAYRREEQSEMSHDDVISIFLTSDLGVECGFLLFAVCAKEFLLCV